MLARHSFVPPSDSHAWLKAMHDLSVFSPSLIRSAHTLTAGLGLGLLQLLVETYCSDLLLKLVRRIDRDYKLQERGRGARDTKAASERRGIPSYPLQQSIVTTVQGAKQFWKLKQRLATVDRKLWYPPYIIAAVQL
jgi:hypothetical protein